MSQAFNQQGFVAKVGKASHLMIRVYHRCPCRVFIGSALIWSAVAESRVVGMATRLGSIICLNSNGESKAPSPLRSAGALQTRTSSSTFALWQSNILSDDSRTLARQRI